MSQVINTNVMSLNAQRNLSSSQGALATSLERLSSGLRINSAKDDAAGLAISERFTTQIRGMNQAVRNANDGISLSQTSEGALQEVSNNLQRIRELAVQARNATNSESDRAALDQEVQQRIAEIDRIANQTAFNGQKVLDGNFGTAAFQVGANVGETISVTLDTSARAGDLGQIASATADFTLDETSAGTYVNAEGQFVNVTTGTGGGVSVQALTIASGDALTIQVGDASAVSVSGEFDTLQDLADAISAAAGGVTVSIDGAELSIRASEDITFGGGGAVVGALFTGTAELDGSLNSVSVKTASDADDAILRVDAALTAVSDLRSEFGAIQNRFESVIANLSTATENLSASRSRIMDADFAAETAELTRAQILQQAGVSMLSQANAVPQSVLGLLQ